MQYKIIKKSPVNTPENQNKVLTNYLNSQGFSDIKNIKVVPQQAGEVRVYDVYQATATDKQGNQFNIQVSYHTLGFDAGKMSVLKKEIAK